MFYLDVKKAERLGLLGRVKAYLNGKEARQRKASYTPGKVRRCIWLATIF